MKKYLYNYIDYIDKQLENNKKTDNLKEEHLVKINFFQHERLIHLIVTVSFAIMTLITILLCKYNSLFIPVTIILTICLIFYIIHYYRLENGVQYLYKQYDKMK